MREKASRARGNRLRCDSDLRGLPSVCESLRCSDNKRRAVYACSSNVFVLFKIIVECNIENEEMKELPFSYVPAETGLLELGSVRMFYGSFCITEE